jgi:hypothetical protein
MTPRWFLALLLALLSAIAAAAAVSTAGADVSQTPVATGCPAAFSTFAVATPPHKVPGQLDDPANGGNGDGYVCALALPDAVRDAYCAQGLAGACELQELGLPIYEFFEDDNPARQRARADG